MSDNMIPELTLDPAAAAAPVPELTLEPTDSGTKGERYVILWR